MSKLKNSERIFHREDDQYDPELRGRIECFLETLFIGSSKNDDIDVPSLTMPDDYSGGFGDILYKLCGGAFYGYEPFVNKHESYDKILSEFDRVTDYFNVYKTFSNPVWKVTQEIHERMGRHEVRKRYDFKFSLPELPFYDILRFQIDFAIDVGEFDDEIQYEITIPFKSPRHFYYPMHDPRRWMSSRTIALVLRKHEVEKMNQQRGIFLIRGTGRNE